LLVVSGHDPSGAGIDADRAALEGLVIDPRFVVTALTQQDSTGVQAIGARGAGTWIPEARRALPAVAIKFGLLPSREDLEAAAHLVREARARALLKLWVVVDPVIASSSGGRFLDTKGARHYLQSLLPAGVLLTPNLPELAELTGTDLERLVRQPRARLDAAQSLIERGATAVVVKGGHGAESPARDLVLDAKTGASWITHPRIPGAKVRGSGCRFATRLAALLALETDLVRAVKDASDHVYGRLQLAARGA
jgi:hydroxymethylpyrimidine/phosphomethylpyrimidine kinase